MNTKEYQKRYRKEHKKESKKYRIGYYQKHKDKWSEYNKKNRKFKLCKCGNKIDFRSKRCKSCETTRRFELNIINTKGKNNPMYGKKGFWSGKRRLEHSKLMTGKNNPAYKDGTSGIYPIEFTEFLKESIRKRDNYKCKNCGMTEEEHLIVIGKVLNVHHIDYNKENCLEPNLITTCESCNLRANYNREYWKEFYSNKLLENCYEHR
jgi:hypothetical protein